MEPKKILKIAAIILGGLFLLYLAVVTVNFQIGSRSVMKMADRIGASYEEAGDFGLAYESAPLTAMNKSYPAGIAADSAGRGQAAPAPAEPDMDRKVIKTGHLSMKVEKAETAAEAVTNIARLNRGEVYNSNFSESSRGVTSGYMTVRVPDENFENAFDKLKQVGTQVMSEATNAQDITEEYIDLEARLKNKRAEEQSFLALLNRSGKIEEVLAVTREVARVRGEIEQLEGRKRYLDSQTDMSTITVNITEDIEITPVGEDWRPWQVVKNAVRELIQNSQNFTDGLIRFIVVVLPAFIVYGLIFLLVYLVGRRIYRHWRRKKDGKEVG